MDTDPVRFVGSPPPQRQKQRRSTRWDDTAERLRTRPGQWAELVSYDRQSPAASLAYQINRSRGAWHGRWEATSRTQDDGRTYVYVCYLGSEQEETTA